MNTSLYSGEPRAAATSWRQAHHGLNAGYRAPGAAAHGNVRVHPRVDTAITAMVLTAQGSRSGCIRNLSPHGLMISMAVPPQRGECVEIFVNGHSLVGQVKWANDHQAGIALSEAIEVSALILGKNAKGAARMQAIPLKFAKPEAARPAAATMISANQIFANQIQFVVIMVFVVCAALVIGSSVHDFLAGVVGQLKAGMP